MLRFAGQRNSGMLPTLEAFSEFRLTVSAYNSRGAGPESEPHAFRTPEGGGRGAGGGSAGPTRASPPGGVSADFPGWPLAARDKATPRGLLNPADS